MGLPKFRIGLLFTGQEIQYVWVTANSLWIAIQCAELSWRWENATLDSNGNKIPNDANLEFVEPPAAAGVY